MLWLHGHTIIIEVAENTHVLLAKDQVGDALEEGEDIPCRSTVLASHETRPELALRDKEIQIITADEILSHADNRGTQGCLTVMIGGVLGNVTGKLGYLHLGTKPSLETSKENLSLGRL